MVRLHVLEKPELSFDIDLITTKTNLVLSGNEIEKIPQPRLHNHSCLDCHLGTDDWDFILFRQCRAYKHLKETKTFWQLRLKTFSLLGLNEKEEYLH